MILTVRSWLTRYELSMTCCWAQGRLLGAGAAAGHRGGCWAHGRLLFAGAAAGRRGGDWALGRRLGAGADDGHWGLRWAQGRMQKAGRRNVSSRLKCSQTYIYVYWLSQTAINLFERVVLQGACPSHNQTCSGAEALDSTTISKTLDEQNRSGGQQRDIIKIH